MIPGGGKIIEEVGVVIASTNRPEILRETLFSLVSRRTQPGIVIISLASEKDCPEGLGNLALPIKAVYAKAPPFSKKQKGLPFQRNIGLAALPPGIKTVVFLDDDMEIHDMCIEEVRGIFERNPDLAAFSGCLVANGDIARVEARQMLDDHVIPQGMPDYGLLPREWPGLYGCCMCMRRDLVEKEPFDENLPLYAIGEDTEIGFRLRKFGKVGGSARCPVVHLASGSGRVPEVGVGYSQIINYIYFLRKKIGMPVLQTLFRHLFQVVFANAFFVIFKRLKDRNNIDRKGRLQGNVLAIRDIFLMKIDPSRLVSHILNQKHD